MSDKGKFHIIGKDVLTGTHTTGEPMNINSFISNGSWGDPSVDVNEYSDRIEIVYKQTSMIVLAVYPPRPPEVRVYKVIFSCINGKWNKSAPIFGKVEPAREEGYTFE